MNTEYVLPMVDISLLNSRRLEDRMQVAAALDQACKEVGFLYIRGEQLNSLAMQDLLSVAQAYFQQPLEDKLQNYIGNSKNHSGYVPIGEEQFAGNSYD